jgi:hypothetical protein
MARQLAIVGTETPEIREIEDAAEAVGDLCDDRRALQVKEQAARKVLMAAMHKHKKRIYKMQDGRIAELVKAEEEKVRVRKAKKVGGKKKGKS